MLECLQEFDPQVENIATYLEKLQLYFDANRVEEGKKVAVLLTVIGAKAYGIIRSLLALTLLKDKHFV